MCLLIVGLDVGASVYKKGERSKIYQRFSRLAREKGLSEKKKKKTVVYILSIYRFNLEVTFIGLFYICD